MEPRQLQTAILQSPQHTLKYGLEVEDDELPVVVSHTVPKPAISSAYHVVVRVLAVALNPIDYKMLAHFPAAGNMAGCDFCGIVVERGTNAVHDVGTRVCGATFPYSWSATQVQPQDDVHLQQKQTQQSGAFAEFLTADSRLLLRVPDTWSDSGGAALGQVGWGTASLALSDPEALGLTGLPSAPAGEGEPVLVYGAATATGTMACQLLALSGYKPIGICSTQSAPLAAEFGAVSTAEYTSPSCVETVRALAGVPLRHALDCITNADSVATCFAALARTGGRYVCLESLPESWRTRRAVRVKEVMGYEGHGNPVQVGTGLTAYSRPANPTLFALCCNWTVEMQKLLDMGKIKHHPVKELDGRWDGIRKGLSMLKRGEVRGHKLVVRIAVS